MNSYILIFKNIGLFKVLIFQKELVTLSVTNNKIMSASTKLSTAVKAIYFLSVSHPEPKNSTEISAFTGVNASKLRKILSMLVKNDILESTHGTSGGFLLKKMPEKLHLQEIYCAVEDRKAFYLDVNKNRGGSLDDTEKINNFFLDLFSDVQVDIENKMRDINIKDIIEKIKTQQRTTNQ